MSYVPPSQTPPPTPNYSSPPTPPPSYYYPPPLAAPRGSFLGGFTKLGGLFSVAIMLVGIGFYLCLILMTHSGHLTPTEYREGKGPDRIAIIPVTGTIGGGTASYVHAAVEAVLKDETIKAVVLRVESPGGGATASDQILHEINRLREKRKLPIVASYGDYAASGGYYVSCQSDIIFAEPTTVTGSIGVLAEVPTMQVLLEQKLGVKFEELHASGSPEKMTANSMFRDWTEKDRAAMGKLLDAIYGQFSGVVAEGRKGKITAEKLPGIANGSIYTAPEAKANGLIDEIGYLDAAIAKATVMGKFKESEPPVVVFHAPRGLFEVFAGSSSSSGNSGSLQLETLLDSGHARAFLDDMATPRIQMRMSR